jgi:hypothetical protein
MDDQDNVMLDGSMETVRYLQAKIRELRAERERLLKVVAAAGVYVQALDNARNGGMDEEVEIHAHSELVQAVRAYRAQEGEG